MSADPARIAARVAEIRREVAAACQRSRRNPEAVRLIAVTKSQGPEVLAPLAAAGIRDIGENRCDHQQAMLPEARRLGLTMHAIGRIQGRQLAELIPISDCLHSLADPGHIERLAKAVSVERAPFPILVQINTSGEAAKAGVPPDELTEMLTRVQAHQHLAVVGLMTMAPEGADEVTLRQIFSAVRRLADQHGLPRCSMGMSQDAIIAVECGSTDVRIGTRFFS